MNEPLTPWGEAELAAEMAHEASKSVTTMTDAEWIALADFLIRTPPACGSSKI